MTDQIINIISIFFSLVTGGGLVALLSTRYRVKKEKQEAKQEEFETKEIEFALLKKIIVGQNEEIDRIKKCAVPAIISHFMK